MPCIRLSLALPVSRRAQTGLSRPAAGAYSQLLVHASRILMLTPLAPGGDPGRATAGGPRGARAARGSSDAVGEAEEWL